jgi:glycine/D-amino acid oxidase-like deaminating enzyme
MHKITIVGAGFAGLAVGQHLYRLFGEALALTYYDPYLGKGGASGIAAGLLHKFGSMDAKKSSIADEAFSLAMELIEESALYGSSPVLAKGLIRPILSERQEMAFKQAAIQYPKEALYLDPEQTHQKEPLLCSASSLYIPDALALDAPSYVQGLIASLKEKGALFIEEPFPHQEKVEHPTIFAYGASALSHPLIGKLPIKALKGQLLLLPWPSSYPPLKHALNSKIYMVPHPEGMLIAGSTFERDKRDPAADISIAKEKILPELYKILPFLEKVEPQSCLAAVRVSSANYLPIAQKIGENLWYFGALGSKGLLMHAYYGKLLAEQMYADIYHL